MANNKIDWTIHLISDGVKCDTCGKVEESFLPNTCNAHTHGMGKYNHLDFQLVINYPKEEICRILNTFGVWVQNGKKFKDGDLVSGIYEDCDVRLREFEETGRQVLRIIIADKENRFPDDENCAEPYSYQRLMTNELCSKEKTIMKIRIHQINTERDVQRLKFMNYKYITNRCGGKIPADIYDCIYEGEVEAETLEDIYSIFNLKHPADFKGHSLSVSDVVENITDSGSEFHFCDSIGFVEVKFER